MGCLTLQKINALIYFTADQVELARRQTSGTTHIWLQ